MNQKRRNEIEKPLIQIVERDVVPHLAVLNLSLWRLLQQLRLNI